MKLTGCLVERHVNAAASAPRTQVRAAFAPIRIQRRSYAAYKSVVRVNAAEVRPAPPRRRRPPHLRAVRRSRAPPPPAPQDAVAEADDGAEAPEAPSPVMSMADSLVERAKEVAASGVADDAFRAVYVPELEAELAQLREAAAGAASSSAALEETLKTVKDQFVRMTADFDNFRKRTAAEREALKTSVRGDTVLALIPLIDNFELAKAALKLETEGEKKIDAAYQGLYKQMVEAFRGLGLEAVPGAGAPFDPEVHEAIMREPSEDVPDGHVLEEFRKGFRLGDRLLRPAMVKVAFSDAPAAAAAAAEEEDGGSGDEGAASE
jgi:molecular chaperone GrpE